jgi:hypothetical protein
LHLAETINGIDTEKPWTRLARCLRSIFYRLAIQRTSDMNENVIKFRRPEPPKQPRKPNPQLRKLAIIVGVIAFFAAAWAYFNYLA